MHGKQKLKTNEMKTLGIAFYSTHVDQTYTYRCMRVILKIYEVKTFGVAPYSIHADQTGAYRCMRENFEKFFIRRYTV